MAPESRHYRAFGLHWQSALPLPELREVAAPAGVADVTVEVGAAPEPHAPLVVAGVRAGPDLFWMEVPGVVRLSVTGGRRMVVEPATAASPGDVRAFVLGSAAGALLHQREVLPLHGSAIAIDGRAIAFVAPSGGGKSTVAMHLHHLGHRVIADDLCAISVVDGEALLWPGLRNLKLWRGSLAAIDRAPDGFEPVLTHLDKYRVPIDAPAEDRAFPLAAVVRLGWGESPALSRLGGAEGVGVLIANTFRGQLVRPMGREAAHWRQCLQLFDASGVHTLVRPRDLTLLGDVSTLIVERFAAPALA